MKNFTIKIVCIFTVSLFTFQATQSQEKPANEQSVDLWANGIGHSSWLIATSPEEKKQILELWESIGEDLKNEQNELAGTYVKRGYSSGYFLRWSINKGYIMIPYFDQNLITDFSYGKVSYLDHSEVVFIPARDFSAEYRSMKKMPLKWTAIFDYFVPVEMLKGFGMFRAGLGVYNEFNGQCCEWQPDFLAKRIDGKGKTVSYPVPPKYKTFIKNPIKGQITFVGKKKFVQNWGFQGEIYGQWMEKAALIPVKINVGRKDGVKKNMLFRLIGEPDFVQYLEVAKINQKTSEAYIVRDLSFERKETFRDDETDEEKPLPPIRIGIKVTTSPVID